jgi:serine/threonine-protein kinase PpkA
MEQEELSPEELSALLSSYMPDIPGYRVLRRIGKGGMSQVYLGVQESLDRQVAIKVMSPEALRDEVSKQRFEHEARTIAKLEHPCIVGIHEVGRSPQGLMYYVLPYLAKGHLGQRDFTNDESRTFEVLRALLSALEFAHARGIVHRDVKAENVLFDNADRPLLTDFGIALSRKDNTRITTAGLAVGSGGYMAPEQARGEAVDGRADLYSVGVLAYELVTGRLPFLANDTLALALMHAQDPIPRLSPDKKHWQGFIDRAMAKMPENRFRNAQQMLTALNLLSETSKTRSTNPSNAIETEHKTRKSLRQSWWIPATLIVVGLAILAYSLNTLLKDRGAGNNDFFVAETTKPNDLAMPVKAAPSAAVAVASEPELKPLPAPEQPTTLPIAADPKATSSLEESLSSTTAVEATDGNPYANVKAGVLVSNLSYDPSVPGAKHIFLASKQLKLNRFSTPAGDNAMESLSAAYKIAPKNSNIVAMSDTVIAGMSKAINDAVKNKHDDTAKTLYNRSDKFAKELNRQTSPAWLSLNDTLPNLIVVRLQKDTSSADARGITATKKLVAQLKIDPKLLEPAWSKAAQLPKAGDLVKDKGPTMVLIQAPSPTGKGFAVMRKEVSRAEYESFSRATNRAASICKNAFASIFTGKIDWQTPGFKQNGDHPVVCVSHQDAAAYAQWLGQRTGQKFRLPTSSEWRSLVNYKAGDACRAGVVACGNKGTSAGSGTPSSPFGVYDLQGNVSEWLGDDGGSGRYPAAGLSWRDLPSSPANKTTRQNANRGYDDVGFRLVRDVSADEL